MISLAGPSRWWAHGKLDNSWFLIPTPVPLPHPVKVNGKGASTTSQSKNSPREQEAFLWNAFATAGEREEEGAGRMERGKREEQTKKRKWKAWGEIYLFLILGSSTKSVVLKLERASEPHGELVQTQTARYHHHPLPRFLGPWGLRICISNMLLGDYILRTSALSHCVSG